MISMELPGIPLEHGYVGHGHTSLGHTSALGAMGHGHLEPLHAHPHHQSTAIIHHALINSTHTPSIGAGDDAKKAKSKFPAAQFHFQFGAPSTLAQVAHSISYKSYVYRLIPFARSPFSAYSAVAAPRPQSPVVTLLRPNYSNRRHRRTPYTLAQSSLDKIRR